MLLLMVQPPFSLTTWFVPGLFRRGPLLHEFDGSNGGWTISGLRSDDAACVPVKAGSVAVFWSLTPHMTGPNNSDTGGEHGHRHPGSRSQGNPTW